MEYTRLPNRDFSIAVKLEDGARGNVCSEPRRERIRPLSWRQVRALEQFVLRTTMQYRTCTTRTMPTSKLR